MEILIAYRKGGRRVEDICGIVGHSHKECDLKVASNHECSSYGYGDWMRATLLKKNTAFNAFHKPSSSNWSGGGRFQGRGSHIQRGEEHRGSEAGWWRRGTVENSREEGRENGGGKKHMRGKMVSGEEVEGQEAGSLQNVANENKREECKNFGGG